MKIKNILILAGGDGTRFWPLEDKILTNFLGKPYLKHIIDGLSGRYENLFVVASESNKEKIKKILPYAQIIIQKSPEGMGAAVVSCKNQIRGETLILGNDIFDYSVIDNLVRKEKDLVLLAKKVDKYFPGGYLRFNQDRLIAIEEKPDPEKVPSNLVRLVVDYFRDISLMIEAIEKTNLLSDIAYEQALTSIIKKNNATYWQYDGDWYTLKYPWDILMMMKYFFAKIKTLKTGKNPKISKQAIITGPVWIGDNVKIGDFSKIVGPSYIGNNVIIGDHVLIRESHLGDGVLVGGGSEVVRSYLGEKVSLHRNYVGDSVLGENVLMGAEAAIANFRFDEAVIQSKIGKFQIETKLKKFGSIIGRQAKIGVNATVFPGVKIGKNTFIAPGEKVREDIEDNMFFSKESLRKNILNV